MSTPLDAVLNELEHADAEFGAGRADGYQDMYSHADDVTIFGAFGGHEQGWDTVGPRLAWAATQFNPRTDAKLERTLISANFGTELGYTVTLEVTPGSTTVAGTSLGGLRVTHIYRLEGDRWKIVHRHADPLTNKVPPAGTPT